MLGIKTDAKKAELRIEKIQGRIGNLTPAFKDFHAYMIRRGNFMFTRLRRGGEFRGVKWDPFSANSIGRKRPSGKRITEKSSLMQDTGRLRNSLLTNMQIRRGLVLKMDTPVSYAPAQNALRRFQFFEDPKDVKVLRNLIVKHLAKEAFDK